MANDPRPADQRPIVTQRDGGRQGTSRSAAETADAFDASVVTDYDSLSPEYRAYLQRKMDEASEQRHAS